MTSLTGTRSNIYSEAFRVWKCARHRLDAAAKEYADACTSLGGICSEPPSCDATQSMLEEVLTALDPELPHLTPSLELATNSNKTIKVLRNRSISLVPINVLPSELLVRIFEFLGYSATNPGTMDNTPTYPETLLRVSTSWRRIVLDNRQLWTRITLALPCAYEIKLHEQVEARLERAHESLLDFHVYGGSPWDLDSRMKGLLIRIAPRLGSICWQAHRHYDASFLNHVLPFLVELGTLGSVHSLRLEGNALYRFLADPATFPSMERVERFLAALQYLTLHNVFIDWSSNAYHGLVELDLSFERSFAQSPTVDQFAAILLASPRLRALKLHDFGLQLGSSPNTTTPVRLDGLEVLFLGNIQQRCLKLLLPLIQPGPRPLYMRFQLHKHSTNLTHFVQLLRRSHVVKLMIAGTGGYPPDSLFASLRQVQHLLLVDFLTDNLFFESMAKPLILYAGDQYPSIWPNLRNLHLVKCVFLDTKFYDSFTAPVAYNFRLWIWDVARFYGMDDLPVDLKSPEGQRLLGLLVSYIPGMQDMRTDKSVMSCAWSSALDFSDMSC